MSTIGSRTKNRIQSLTCHSQSVDRRNGEHLARINQVRILDLVLVGLEDRGVTRPLAIGPARQPPQGITRLNDNEGLRPIVGHFVHAKLGPLKRHRYPGRDLALCVDLVNTERIQPRLDQGAGVKPPDAVGIRPGLVDAKGKVAAR